MKTIISLTGFVLSLSIALAQGQLNIGDSTQIIFNGPVQMNLNNTDLTVEGDFVAGESTVILSGNGTATPASIGGSTQWIPFYDLTLDNSGDALLNQDIVVANELSFQTGILDLNTFNIDLQDTGTLVGETENSHIVGPLGGVVSAVVLDLNMPNQVNPGNLGLEITSSEDLHSVFVSRGHQAQTISPGMSISRTYDVSFLRDATLRFHYLDAELNGISESSLEMVQAPDPLINSWSKSGGSTPPVIDSFANVVEQAQIDTEGFFTLTDKTIFTDLEEELPVHSWSVYPNPSQGELFVEIDMIKAGEVSLELFDVGGRRVMRKTHFLSQGNQRHQLDLGQLAGGAYQLVLKTEGKRLSQKLIVL